MRAMILAAGLGTRLRPYTNELPKPLLPVGDRPLIHYNLLLLEKYGITDVVINLHHHGEKLRKALGQEFKTGLRIVFSEEPQILGTGGGVKKVSPFFDSRTFILVNGDILVDLNLDKVVEQHFRKRAVATMVLREDPEAERWGVIGVDAQGRVRRVLDQGDWEGEKLQKYMFTGVHVLEPRVLDYIPPARCYSITDAYMEMVKKGEKIFGYVMKGFWMDLGTPERYQKTHQRMKKGGVRLSYLR